VIAASDSKQKTASERRFRELALAALDAEYAERGRLARKLHDESSQILSGAGLQLDILKMDLEGKVPGIAQRMAEIQELLERVVRQIRELSHDLHPDLAEGAGLQRALEMVAGRYRRSFRGSLRLTYDSAAALSPAAAIAMERIATEAVDNAVRHGRSKHIEIIVKTTRGRTAMEIRDDGRGFDPDAARGLGLSMIEYSAAKAGLELSITTRKDAGVKIKVVAPSASKS
jgi:signal transduction histidine kinase